MKTMIISLLCAWMIPGFADSILYRWSDPATWDQPGFRVATCNELDCLCAPMVPVEGKSVTIPPGARVLLDVDTPVLNGVMIHGELIFEDKAGVGLSAHWVMIMGENSALRVGSEEVPFGNETHITLYGTEIDENVSGEDAPWSSGTKFLMAMDGGTLSLHGASREKRSWTKLDANAFAGDTTLTVEDANTGWEVGDRIAIGPSGYDYRDAADVIITAIEGAEITFEPPLHADHWGERQFYGGTMVDQRAPVGLLSRNIRIQGAEDSLIPRSELSDFPGYGPYTDLPMDLPLNFGAHVMIMGGLGGRPKAFGYVEGVEFTRSGQVSLQGRYTFHWHWVGDADGQYFRNSSIHHAFHRGVNVHRTANVVVADNVTYKVNNHNYVWAEDGHDTEANNQFLRNLAIHVLRQSHSEYPLAFGDRGTQANRVGTGPDPVKQEEWRASGFWGRNPIHTLEGNHVAGVRDGMGYFYDIGGGSAFEPRLDLFMFRDNTVHSVSDFHSGLALNNDLYPPATVGSGLFVRNRNEGEMHFEGLNAFKNKLGVWLESNHHTVRDSVLSDNAGAIMMFQGRIEDSLIVGITGNPVGRDFPEVRGRSPRSINALNALSSGVLIFAGQGGQKTIKASDLQFFNTPGGAIRSNDIFAFHGTYFQGLEMDEDTLPLRMTGLGEGAFYDADGMFDPAGLGRPTWLTFGDPHYINRHSVFDMSMDAWRTPATQETVMRFDAEAAVPFGPAAARMAARDRGFGVDLIGKGGLAFPLTYEISPHTVIEFFANDNEAYGNKNWTSVGIGLVNGLTAPGSPRFFSVHGAFGDRELPFPSYLLSRVQGYLKPSGGISPPGRAFRIPVGQYYTGPASHLVLYGQTAGISNPDAHFRFHLVRIYEEDAMNFRGWPVVREIYENLTPETETQLFFANLFSDPRYPGSPSAVQRVAPFYGSGAIHSYGNRELHAPRIHRSRSSAAMIDRSYLVVDESGEYTFTFLTEFRAVSLELAPVSPEETVWTTVIHQDPGISLSREPREVTGTVFLEAGRVYHWRHTALQMFGAAPTQHTLHWRKPSMSGSEPFNITYLRPAPGPLAANEPSVVSVQNDSIPDDWKLQMGMDPLSEDPAFRADGSLAGDGISNLQRYLFGVHAMETEFLPGAGLDMLPAGGLQVRFSARSGRIYQLQTSADLKEWSNVGPPRQTAYAEEDLAWAVEPDERSTSFFRIKVRK
jgi:hypothetical protein